MSTVVKNGFVLGHPGTNELDVLVEDGSITAIGPGLTGETVINASGKVVAPGFVDTHRHLAQTPLRGIAADMTLGYYLQNIVQKVGAAQGIDDVRNSMRLAAAEAIDAGVTTVLDWSGVGQPDQVAAAIDALAASGLRVLFGHSNPDDEADVRKHAGRTGLVTTAVAPLGPDYLSIEDTERHIRLARELGVIASMHIGGGAHTATSNGITKLHDAGLLGPDVHFVHGNVLSDDELKMIVDSGASLTVTPVVELMMGHGGITSGVAYQRFVDAGGAPAMGVDVTINNTPDMFSEMRAGLMYERGQGQVRPPAKDMLTAATINGARAIGLGDIVGSLEVGKRADIILVDGLEHLFANGEEMVIGGLVTSTNVADVHTVLIDGKVVKRDGVLVDHDIAELREAAREIAHRTLS